VRSKQQRRWGTPTRRKKLSNLAWNLIFTNEKQLIMPIKSLLGVFILASFLISCNQKEKVEANINNYTNEVLVSSQEITEASIRRRFVDLQDKLNNPDTRDSALVYKPKAGSAIAVGNNMTDYLDTLVDRLIKSGKVEEDDSLFERLKMYENSVVKIDANVNQLFEKCILFIDTSNDFKNINRKQFYNRFLNGITQKQVIIFLNSLKQNVLINEAEMVKYFDLNVNFSSEGYYKFQALITQNSKHFKPNDELEIVAGIGAFSSVAKPVLVINKKNIDIDAEGAFRYKMQVSNELGKHTVPIKVSFTKPNGEKAELNEQVVYYVE